MTPFVRIGVIETEEQAEQLHRTLLERGIPHLVRQFDYLTPEEGQAESRWWGCLDAEERDLKTIAELMRAMSEAEYADAEAFDELDDSDD